MPSTTTATVGNVRSIVLTGHPCSGKTTLARAVRDRALLHPSNAIDRVIIINEECVAGDSTTAHQGADADDGTAPTVLLPPCSSAVTAACYESSATEKQTRGALKVAFDRAVNSASTSTADSNNSSSSSDNTTRTAAPSTLIILDSLNYIKGYRYELFCIAKAAGAAHCVVWCLNTVENVRRWNTARSSTSYSDEQLTSLIQRYEPPDARNRWDRPLYKIPVVELVQPLLPNNDGGEMLEDNDIIGRQGGGEDVAAGDALDQSVYNMHNLSQTMMTAASTATTSPPTMTKDDDKNNSTAKATFKRASATFKRATMPQDPEIVPGSSQARTTTNNTTGTLTAEALLAISPHQQSSSSAAAYSSYAVDDPSTLAATVEDAFNYTNQTATAASLPTKPAPPPIAPPSVSAGRSAASTKAPTAITCTGTNLEDRIDRFLDSFLLEVQPLREGTSTRQHVATNANVLHRVDAITQRISGLILRAAAAAAGAQQQQELTNASASGRSNASAAAGGQQQQPRRLQIFMTDPTTADDDGSNSQQEQRALYLHCAAGRNGGVLSAPDLARVRRQYIQWVANHPLQDATERGVAESFLAYIETQQR
jgi:tRNA uridine 5-carbamoylmethylation protein Kti12